MKIGYDAKRAFRNYSGLGEFSRNLIGSIIDIDEVEEVLLYSPQANLFSDNFNSKKFTSVFPIGIWKPISSIWRSLGISRERSIQDLDVYHGLSAELPFFLPKKVKKIVTIHDVLFERFPEDYNFFDRIFHRVKVKYACKSADKIVAISEKTKSELVKFYGIDPLKIEVIYVPVRVADCNEKSTLNIKRPFVFMISSFQYRKNQTLLIKAFEKIKDEVSFDLYLVGRGKKHLNISKKYVQENNLTSRIKFIENANNVDKEYLYKNAVFSVYTSKLEGFGMPIIESMLYQCPVLVSDNDTHTEVGGDAAIYFENGSVVSLSEKLIEVSEYDAIKIEEINKRGISHAMKFDVASVGKEYLNVYG